MKNNIENYDIFTDKVTKLQRVRLKKYRDYFLALEVGVILGVIAGALILIIDSYIHYGI